MPWRHYHCDTEGDHERFVADLRHEISEFSSTEYHSGRRTCVSQNCIVSNPGFVRGATSSKLQGISKRANNRRVSVARQRELERSMEVDGEDQKETWWGPARHGSNYYKLAENTASLDVPRLGRDADIKACIKMSGRKNVCSILIYPLYFTSYYQIRTGGSVSYISRRGSYEISKWEATSSDTNDGEKTLCP